MQNQKLVYRSLFASSSDPSGQTLSNTIQGLVVVASAIVPLLALQFFHVQVNAGDVSSLITEGAAIVGSILTIRGIILKIINRTATV